jgi:tetratricopeptide (TPR) repeat protein
MRSAQGSRMRCAVVAVCVLAALLTGCSNPDEKKRKYLESGQRHFDKGEYGEAQIQFRNAIQVDPRFASAHYKLARTAMKLGDNQTADQELLATVQIQPDPADPEGMRVFYAAHLDLANLLILVHQLSEAKEHLDLLEQKQPDADFYIARAGYNAAANNAPAALADIQKALKMDPKRSDSYLMLAKLQVQGQQWDAAEGNIKTALVLSPKSTEGLVLLGNFYQIRGRFPEAEQMFRRAIDSAADDPNPRLSLAGLYMAENKPGLAEEFLRKSKNDFPNNPEGYRMLGNFYIGNNRFGEAATEYATLYRDHAKDPLVKKNYIQLLIVTGQLDEARKLNDEVIKAKPDDSDAQVFKGQIEIQSGRASDALNTLQAVLKSEPDNWVAHYQLGMAFDQLGNASRAEAAWRDAVRLHPQMVEAHRALAAAAIQRSDAGGIAQEADQIIAIQPASPDGYLLRAVAEIDRKQYAMADQYIHRSLEKEPNNPSAYVQLGHLRMAQSQYAEAQKAYQQALDQDPNSTEALGGVVNIDLAQKQPDRAIAMAKTQLSRYPKNAGFHIILGQLLLDEKKDLAGAEAEFKQASDLDNKNSEALIKLGLVRDERGATDQALQTYLDGAKAIPKQILFYQLAGSIYERKQDWEHAKQQYQKVLEIQPDNALASNSLAYVMLEQGGNVDVAFAMAQTARQKLPELPNTADTLGWAFYHKHVYTSAITLFKEAVKKEPDKALYNYHLGLAYAKNGQVALCQQQLDRVIKIDPKFPDLEKLRQALAELKASEVKG